MIFVGEAFGAEVWPDVRIKGYKFNASESGLMGVYVRNDLDAKVTVTFPDDPRLVDRLAEVKGTLNGEPVTVYGTYAINMHARSPQHTKGSPKARKDYDEALFKEVKKPFDGQEGALVALLGDMNTVWSRENVVCGANGEWKAKSDRNQHALVLARWKNALLEPFGEPLGDGAWTYKHIEPRAVLRGLRLRLAGVARERQVCAPAGAQPVPKPERGGKHEVLGPRADLRGAQDGRVARRMCE